MPTDLHRGQGYKQIKAKLGLKKARPWKWMPFINPARKVLFLFMNFVLLNELKNLGWFSIETLEENCR